MRFVKPLDETLLLDIFKRHQKILTLENGCLQGGVGSAIIEFMIDNGYSAEVKRLGIPDDFIEHGKPMELHKECGYDPDSIKVAIKALVSKKEFAI